MKRSTFLFLVLLVTASPAFGQATSTFWGYSWDISVPLGNTRDFISQTSARGFTFQGRTFLQPNFSVGGTLGWQVFYEEATKTSEFHLDADKEDLERDISGALSGKQFRYSNSLPIMFSTHYYLGDPTQGSFSAFAGLNAGTNVIVNRVDVGLFTYTRTRWHLALAPEAGLIIPAGSARFLASLRYNYAFKVSDRSDQSYLSFQIGLTSGL